MEAGTYEGITLRGNTPSLSYKNEILSGLIDALKERFELGVSETNVMNSTRILHFKNWPTVESPDLGGYINKLC